MPLAATLACGFLSKLNERGLIGRLDLSVVSGLNVKLRRPQPPAFSPMRLLPRLWRENRNLIAFLVLMALFRSAIADWNVVPSGSMLPTIREGDRIVVDKMAYDLRIPFTHIAIAHLHDPQRGDIVTVDSSAAHELIVKRLIGVPGDVVAMRDNVLYIDGKRAGYQRSEERRVGKEC